MVNNLRTMIKMNNLIKNVLFTGLILILVSSCDPTKKYEKEQDEEIQNYLLQHPDLSFVLKSSGLYYMDIAVGTGDQPATGDTAFVYYTGYFLDGSKFDTNVGGDVYSYPVNGGWVIPGFDEGVMLMKVGGSARLLMPSSLGYGNSGYLMPAFTPLLFEVMLDSLVAGPGGK
jgi:FKBP-type peptidyl-prolyl cis-trans isomerase